MDKMLKDKANFRREKEKYMSETKLEIIRSKKELMKRQRIYRQEKNVADTSKKTLVERRVNK